MLVSISLTEMYPQLSWGTRAQVVTRVLPAARARAACPIPHRDHPLVGTRARRRLRRRPLWGQPVRVEWLLIPHRPPVYRLPLARPQVASRIRLVTPGLLRLPAARRRRLRRRPLLSETSGSRVSTRTTSGRASAPHAAPLAVRRGLRLRPLLWVHGEPLTQHLLRRLIRCRSVFIPAGPMSSVPANPERAEARRWLRHRPLLPLRVGRRRRSLAKALSPQVKQIIQFHPLARSPERLRCLHRHTL